MWQAHWHKGPIVSAIVLRQNAIAFRNVPKSAGKPALVGKGINLKALDVHEAGRLAGIENEVDASQDLTHCFKRALDSNADKKYFDVAR